MIELIKKRDGRIVNFDRIRIENAISKAFNAQEVPYDNNIIDGVLDKLKSTDTEGIINVEQIQNIVEKKIAEHGYFNVAKAYILYRHEHERRRNKEFKSFLEQIENKELMVKKRDGELQYYNAQEIKNFISECCLGLNGTQHNINVEEIVSETRTYLYDRILTKEINQAIILVCRSKIERDNRYSYLAARILLNDLYKDVVGLYEFAESFDLKYVEKFKDCISYGVKKKYYSAELLKFDLDQLIEAIVPKRDLAIKYLGLQTLYDRYLIRDYDQNILEIPQFFWMRVAMGLSINEKNRNERAIEFYNIISTLRFLPSTPTLFHSGTCHPQMSSCYVLTCKDELKNIFKTLGDVAELAKWSGGIGIDWTPIRATGALIKSTNVQSQGVIPFLKILDSTTASINRSGKRRGATCAYLETWHYDIEEFLELRKNTGDERRRTHDLNTAVWISDLFMKRVLEDKTWTLFSPDEVPDLHSLYGAQFEERYLEYENSLKSGKLKLWKQIPASNLWKKMITMLYETGHPWLTFKDACNIRSPQDHVGVINNSNLCTEITLNTSANEFAVCNLGSINLSNHIEDGQIDKSKLTESINTAIRMLDNVIDINFYPVPETENSNLKHRPVGLGIMGFQDALYKTNTPFDFESGVRFSDTIMEFISYHVILASSKLAEEKGQYPSFKGSKWDKGIFPLDSLRLLENERGLSTDLASEETMDWKIVRDHVKEHGLRNSNCMAIAPTATIANIAGCYPSIEPIYKNLYVKSNISGEFTIINHYLIEDLKELGLWNNDIREKIKYFDGSIDSIPNIPTAIKNKYKNAFEIDPEWVIKHAANRAKWIDQSQSINIFTSSESGIFISNIYTKAWKMGLKTTYYLRSMGASSIEKSTLDINRKFEDNNHENKANSDLIDNSCNLEEECESCQ